MPKHRTLKQKREAKHSFIVKWKSGSSKLEFEPNVKRQIQNEETTLSSEAKTEKLPQISAKDLDLGSIRNNIKKSLILSGLILASEIVLYFIWR